ncbi:hypothetical protein JZ751_020969, partial [Albula glossodonta]
PRLTFFSVVASTDSLRFLPFNPFLVLFFSYPLSAGPRLTFFSVVASTDSLRFLPFNPFLVPFFFKSTISRFCPIILSRKIKNFWGSDFSDFFQVRGLRFFQFWPQLIPCVFSHLIHSWFLFSSYPLSAGAVQSF